MHATWLRACQPQPSTPSVEAPSRARNFAATPLAAPVLSCPSLSASITPTSSADSVSKSTTTNGVPLGSQAYAFTPASPSSRSTDGMTAKTPSSSRSRRRGRFSTSPAASRRRHPSTASSASAGVSSESMFATVRKRGKPESLGAALLNEADPAARFEHSPLDVVEGADLLLPHLLGQLLDRDAFPVQVL